MADEATRIERTGVVRALSSAPGPVAWWSELSIEGGEPDPRTHADPFELALDDGTTVRVTCVAGRQTLGPERTLAGLWQKLSSDPLAAPHAQAAPGPYIKVRLRGTVLAAGDRACVIGTVGASEFNPDGGLRDAPSQRATAITADVVASGDTCVADARALQARRSADLTQRPDRIWLVWSGLGALSFAAALARWPRGWDTPLLIGVATMLGALAVAWHPAITRRPQLRRDQSTISPRGILAIVGLVSAGGAISSFAQNLAQPDPTTMGMAVLSLAPFSLLAIMVVESTTRGARGAFALLTAPPGSLADWTTIAGTVSGGDQVPRLGRIALGRNNDTWATDRRIQFAADPTLQVDTPGGPVEVRSQDAIWASNVLASAPGPIPVLRPSDWELVPAGARVLVAGRLRKEGGRSVMAASGVGSLFLFASAAADDPAQVLGRLRRSRGIALACLLVLTALATTTGVVALLGRRAAVLNPVPAPTWLEWQARDPSHRNRSL